MSDFNFKIIEKIGVLSKGTKGWNREFNIVSFNDGEAKYDIRDWSPDHSKMGKGIALTKTEAQLFATMVASMYSDEKEETEIKEEPKSNIISIADRFKKVDSKPKKTEAEPKKSVVKPKKSSPKPQMINGVELPF